MSLLLQYYIPGLCTITLFKFFSSKKLQKENQTLMSFIVSYILLAISNFVINIPIFKFTRNSVWGILIISIILGTIFAISISCIFGSKWFSYLMVKLFHKTQNDSIWKDVLDLKKGSNIKLYIRKCNYYVLGHLRNIEEKDEGSWIVLNEFSKLNKEENKILESHGGDNNTMIAIRLADVEYIEIYN